MELARSGLYGTAQAGAKTGQRRALGSAPGMRAGSGDVAWRRKRDGAGLVRCEGWGTARDDEVGGEGRPTRLGAWRDCAAH